MRCRRSTPTTEEVSDGIFSGSPLDLSEQRLWFDMRRAMVRFHRLVVPLREAVSSLMRREQVAVSEHLYPYFEDVYDHILRVTESSDSLRDLVGTIVETNLSLRDYRQNLIVKKVSSWAAIIAVPALVTGYYGMNVPYPGFASHWGVVVSDGPDGRRVLLPLRALPTSRLALGGAGRASGCTTAPIGG